MSITAHSRLVRYFLNPLSQSCFSNSNFQWCLFYCSSREWLTQRNIRGDSPLSWDFSSCSTKPDEEKNNANFFFFLVFTPINTLILVSHRNCVLYYILNLIKPWLIGSSKDYWSNTSSEKTFGCIQIWVKLLYLS